MISCGSNAFISNILANGNNQQAQDVDEKRIEQNRQEVADLVTNHLNTHDNDWSSLTAVLQMIALKYGVEQLFNTHQRDCVLFKNEEECRYKKVARETVGHHSGKFHLAFFALATGFRGKPHHHNNVNCVSAVLDGPFTETLYEEKDGSVTALKVTTRERGSVVADLVSNGGDKFIHSVANYHKNKIAYSVHVYSAPIGVDFNQYYEVGSINNLSFIKEQAKQQIAGYDTQDQAKAFSNKM